jgi:hypothetical protein
VYSGGYPRLPMKARMLLPLLLLALLGLSSCRLKAVEELRREELFSLAIGKMDSQVDLFQLQGPVYEQKNRLYMRDGLFYLANGSSAKIMELSSYGDLLFLLYNAQSNPPPVSFSSESSEALAATRKAVAYPLREVGEVAVDSTKRLYVEDTVGSVRQVRDGELGVLLSHVVLRFDRHGKLEDFIGQEGVGGTPFPYIESLFLTAADELVVVSRTPRSWLVFWYSSAGALMHRLALDPGALPALPEAPSAVPSLGKLVPDLHRRLLYAVLYYYNEAQAESASRGYLTRIYRIDAESGSWGEHIDVPADAGRQGAVGGQAMGLPPPSYELLGVNARGAFFLLRREDTNLFRLLVLDRGGRAVARRNLVMEDTELYFKTLGLSSEGIIYALLGEEYRARVVWWRSDRLLKEEAGEGG